jgi:hypothetical protein
MVNVSLKGGYIMDKNENEIIPSNPVERRETNNNPNSIDWDMTIANARNIMDGVNQIKPILKNLGPLINRLKSKSIKPSGRKKISKTRKRK